MDESHPDESGAPWPAAGDAGVHPQAGEARPQERLESRVVVYWYLTDLFSSAVFAAILIGGALFWSTQDPDFPAWVLTAAIAVGSVILGLSMIVPPLAYARWRFAVDDRLLSMRYGILFVQERLVPVPRMQHVDLTRGPIERLFGLATLVVFTAGNEGSAFRVPGLGRLRAEGIRDRILAARGHDIT